MLMQTIRSFLARIWQFFKPLLDIYNQQTRNVKIAASVSVGISFLLINRLYKNQQYNKKQFELTANNTSNKAILITGCGSGIGKATALKLNKLGFIVIASCRRQESVDFYLSNKDFTENGSTSYQLDITSNDNILKTKQKIKSFLDKNNYILWGIVNNAGYVGTLAPFEFKGHDMIKQIIDVNVYGTINISHEFVPLLYGRRNKINGYKSSNGGRIVNISAAAAKFAIGSFNVYGATKAAISHFSHGLRIELSPRFGIWCSTIELGAFNTKMTDPQNTLEIFNKLIADIKNKKEITSFYNIKLESDIRNQVYSGFEFPDCLDPVVNDIIHGLTAKYPQRTYKSGLPLIFYVLIYLVKRYKTMERKICCSFYENYPYGDY